MGRRLPLIAALCLALALPLAAAGRPGSTLGWKTHKVPSARFAVGAPATWVDVTSATPSILKELAKEPSLKSLIQLVQQNKLIKLLCADPLGVPNLNVVEATVGKVSLKRFTEANVAQIRQSTLVRGKVTSTFVTLPAGPSAQVEYKEVVAQGPEVDTLQFYFLHGVEAYVLTFTALPSSRAKDAPTFLRSARSSRFIPGS